MLRANEDRRANILSISVGLLARSYTVPFVEKFVERAKAVRGPTPWYRPYRGAETAVVIGQNTEYVSLYCFGYVYVPKMPGKMLRKIHDT